MQFMEGHTASLLAYAQRALDICNKKGVRVPVKQKVRRAACATLRLAGWLKLWHSRRAYSADALPRFENI
jgi:hypothetical protein